MMLKKISILGDSRTFDTYYTNEHYEERYGYDKTFPHLWRRTALRDQSVEYDVIHIPDHFRSGTIQNNIVRLALTNPSIVIVLDGIWESLLNKNHFVQFVEAELRALPKTEDTEIEFSFSQTKLVRLFKSNRLSVSPEQFGERARHIVSYFRRRGRQVIWMTLPVPPRSYVGSTYHAGNYRPISGWEDCLAALNDAVVPTVMDYGGHILDLTNEMEAVGGASSAFIDQWHFSPVFHEHLAGTLHNLAQELLPKTPDADHVSNQYMLGGPEGRPDDDVIIYEGDPVDELSVLSKLSLAQILLYPDELTKIVNPTGNERAEFERQDLR
jgi:hypothetical protein